MQFKKFTRVAAALVCGAIVAGSASVSAFAAITPEVIEAQGLRNLPVNVLQTEHGKIEVLGLTDGHAYTTSTITVKATPDAGYEVGGISTGSYADYEMTAIAENVFTFQMPWAADEGITIQANFVAKDQAPADPADEGVDTGSSVRNLPVNVAKVEHGKVLVEGIVNGHADTDSIIKVKLIPDAGYVEDGFTTGSYADWHITGEKGEYSFQMPWVDDAGITITASFVPAK